MLKTTVAQILQSKETSGESPGWHRLHCGVVCLTEDNPEHSYFLRLYCVTVRGTGIFVTPPIQITQTQWNVYNSSPSTVRFVYFHLSVQAQLHVSHGALCSLKCAASCAYDKCTWMGVWLKQVSKWLFRKTYNFSVILIVPLNTACQVTVGGGIVHPMQVHCKLCVLPHVPNRRESLCLK